MFLKHGRHILGVNRTIKFLIYGVLATRLCWFYNVTKSYAIFDLTLRQHPKHHNVCKYEERMGIVFSQDNYENRD